jgi:hypothetical protein
MKRKILPWLLGIGLMAVSSTVSFAQKGDVYDARLQQGQSPKDGEEFINKMTYDDKSKMLYYIANDDQDLYITLIVSDRAVLQKIMRYGMTTWFNPEGKHKKSLGIEFPVAGGGFSGPPQGGKPGMGDRKEMMNKMMAGKNSELVLIGFSGKGARDTVRLADVAWLNAGMEMMQGEKILITLVVPISKIEPASGTDHLLSMGFETGYMDLNKTGVGQSGGGGMAAESGHSMYGGGPPPGGGATSGSASQGQGGQSQQGQVSISELSKPNKLWIGQVRLTKN